MHWLFDLILIGLVYIAWIVARSRPCDCPPLTPDILQKGAVVMRTAKPTRVPWLHRISKQFDEAFDADVRSVE